MLSQIGVSTIEDLFADVPEPARFPTLALPEGISELELARVFSQLGAFGAQAVGGSQGVAWRRCRFRDISGGAVWLGGTDTWNCNGGDASVTTPTPCTAADPATVDRNYTIEDCGIQQAQLHQEFP